MKKKKLAASLLVAGALAAQAVIPAMAAYTADNNPYGDQHTTFGVRETTESELKNQISFQIPLYVTMVAINSTTETKMAVPTNYIIKNTGNGDTIIGVTKVTAEHLGSDWNVVDSKTAVDSKKMHFTIGGLDVAQKLEKQVGGTYTFSTSNLTKQGDKNVLFDATGSENDRNAVLNAAGNSQFVMDDNGTKKIYPLGKNAENNLTLSAETKAETRTKDKSTVAVFKVVYTVSALGADGNPINTATPYAGEDAALAGYANGNVTNKTN